MRIEGLENAQRVLDRAAELGSGKAVLLLRDEVDDLVLAVQGAAQKAAPVDEGTLRGSATSETKLEGVQLTASVSFGGLASAYAFDQHYREDYNHPKGGQAHYLYGSGSPWEAKQAALLERLETRAAAIVDEELSGR